MRVFVDTGAWFAVQIIDDEHHDRAVDVLRALSSRGATLVTTNQVVGETYTLLRTVRGYRAAARFVELVEATSRLERFFVTEEIERRTFAMLDRYREHAFSFVEGTSFSTMKAERIRHAFAFDAHFAAAGFIRIPDDLPVDQI